MYAPLYSFADEASSTEASSTKEQIESTSTESTPKKLFTLCSQEAIETRDNKIASTRALYNTTMSSALTDRKNKEKAAVALHDEGDKKAAIKLSAEMYKSQAKIAQNALTQARKSAWQTFSDDIQKCRDTQVEEQNINRNIISTEQAVKGNEQEDQKSLKETIKAQIESIRSFFN